MPTLTRVSCRYPQLLKSSETSESLCSDRNSSYDNVEKRIDRNGTLDSKKDLPEDPSEWETMLDTDESDVERVKRNKSFKDRLDPLLCEFTTLLSNTFSAFSQVPKVQKELVFPKDV